MNAKWSWSRYLAFAATGFGPIAVGYVLLLLLLIGLSSLVRGEVDPTAGLVVWALILVVLLVGVPLGAYALCRRSHKWAARTAFVYLAWLVLSTPFAFVLAAAIAGASMAVVEGATTGAELLQQELLFAAQLMVPMHLLIIPWVVLAVLLVMRKQPGWFFPGEE